MDDGPTDKYIFLDFFILKNAMYWKLLEEIYEF